MKTIKTVEEVVEVYITEDGSKFNSKFKAIDYIEKELPRMKFLENKIAKFIKKYYNEEKVEVCILSLEEHNDYPNTNIYIDEVEFDEDFGVDWDEWNEFEKELYIKNGFKINMPGYYWSK